MFWMLNSPLMLTCCNAHTHTHTLLCSLSSVNAETATCRLFPVYTTSTWWYTDVFTLHRGWKYSCWKEIVIKKKKNHLATTAVPRRLHPLSWTQIMFEIGCNKAANSFSACGGLISIVTVFVKVPSGSHSSARNTGMIFSAYDLIAYLRIKAVILWCKTRTSPAATKKPARSSIRVKKLHPH